MWRQPFSIIHGNTKLYHIIFGSNIIFRPLIFSLSEQVWSLPEPTWGPHFRIMPPIRRRRLTFFFCKISAWNIPKHGNYRHNCQMFEYDKLWEFLHFFFGFCTLRLPNLSWNVRETRLDQVRQRWRWRNNTVSQWKRRWTVQKNLTSGNLKIMSRKYSEHASIVSELFHGQMIFLLSWLLQDGLWGL